jgi:hypothetical protein
MFFLPVPKQREFYGLTFRKAFFFKSLNLKIETLAHL